MQIREIREEDHDRYEYIGRQAFSHGRRSGTSWFRDPNSPPMDMIGAWDEAGLQARLCIVAYQIYLGDRAVVPMGGIGGVACLPASRGKGYAGELLKTALQRMVDAGQSLSSLYPFNFDFYQRYGWEWVGHKRTYTVPSRILKSCTETEDVRAVTLDEYPKIASIYEAHARKYRGVIVRDEKAWTDLLQDDDDFYTYTYLYENRESGRPEGYFTYYGGNADQTFIREFVALTPRAYRAMLGLMRRNDMRTQKYKWDAPGDDPLYHLLCHNEIETRLEPKIQARIVDVPRALSAWRPALEARGTLNLGVQDEYAPWNQGVWKIEFEGGEVSVKRTDAEAQVALPIQSLSQAYFGTPALDEVRAAERLTVHDEAAYVALRDLLTGPPMWIMTGF